ncbi:hypothetical protein TIN2_92 [Tsukamurella phage TIN2]|uniref:Uncharacterized protein n=1 Tax=Tsukamurella phage TIN2 TaxID=1636545 RepID=A0A0K0N5U6_9CAUD|nr:hypothetical protein AVT55_gp031 [Tsukamurella phage TIN2]AKJ71782.1 hypothetical protein TIN2_92 [Tsukamurella phage TIN2]
MSDANELPEIGEAPDHIIRLYRDRNPHAVRHQVSVWRNGNHQTRYTYDTLDQALTMARGIVRIANVHRPGAAYQWLILGAEIKCGTANWMENDTVCYVSELPA